MWSGVSKDYKPHINPEKSLPATSVWKLTGSVLFCSPGTWDQIGWVKSHPVEQLPSKRWHPHGRSFVTVKLLNFVRETPAHEHETQVYDAQ